MVDEQRAPERRRIVHVGFGRATVLIGLLGTLALLLLCTLWFLGLSGSEATVGAKTHELFMIFISGSLASFVFGALAAIVFNLFAPALGGLEIEMIPAPPPNPDRAGDGAGRRCPQCGAPAAAERSFCPECDYDFTPADASRDPD